MTDNDLKTRPVPHQTATAPADPGVPAKDPAGVRESPFAGAAPSQASYEVVGDGTPAFTPGAKPTLMDRIRKPAVAAVGGGILILGAGFGAGFAVGHGTAGGGQSAVQGGPGGQGFGGQGFGGQGMGGFPGGQNGFGQNGTGQNGTGQNGTGQDGTTTDGTAGSADSAITT